MNPALSRRGFLKGGGASLVLAVLAGPVAQVDRAFAAVRGLTAERRGTYAAVAAALEKAGIAPFDRTQGQDAAGQFDRWYAAQPRELQAPIDAALDAVERDAGGFSKRAAGEAFGYLRTTLGTAGGLVDRRDQRGDSFDGHLERSRQRIDELMPTLSAAERRQLDLDPTEGHLQTYEAQPDSRYLLDPPSVPDVDSAAGQRREAAYAAVALAALPLQPDYELPSVPPPVTL